MADRETIIRGLDYWARNADNPAIRVDCAAARDYILAGSEPDDVVSEPVTVFWYEHDCEWISKHCDEHHRRSGTVARIVLETVVTASHSNHPEVKP